MIPADKGTYALLLRVTRTRRIRVGRLGLIDFPAGHYLYVGSAFGPGGLRARIAHHLRISARPRWHVDYLRRACRITEVWYVMGKRRECAWARTLAKRPGLMPVTGFGCSDCNCATHLFHTAGIPSRACLGKRLQRMACSGSGTPA